MTAAAEQRATVTVAEAASIIGIGRGLAYEMARTGRLPVVRLGRRIVVPKARLDALLEGRDQPASHAE